MTMPIGIHSRDGLARILATVMIDGPVPHTRTRGLWPEGKAARAGASSALTGCDDPTAIMPAVGWVKHQRPWRWSRLMAGPYNNKSLEPNRPRRQRFAPPPMTSIRLTSIKRAPDRPRLMQPGSIKGSGMAWPCRAPQSGGQGRQVGLARAEEGAVVEGAG